MKKSQTKKDEKIQFLTKALKNNMAASERHNVKTKRTIHDLKAIKPLNQPQQRMFESYFTGNYIIANGVAGTGKTFAAIYLGLNDVLSAKSPQKKIRIVRSVVPSREVGFLPGDIHEKLEPYELPYKDIFSELLGGYREYDLMKGYNQVEFISTSFVRGLTWDNSVIIIDEVQNLNFHEINSIVTRVGNDSKLIVVGDNFQTDLYKSNRDLSGMEKFIKVAAKVPMFDEITFLTEDIIRSEFVKSWICALEETNIG